MNREVHVRFFEGLRVQLPWATHLCAPVYTQDSRKTAANG